MSLKITVSIKPIMLNDVMLIVIHGEGFNEANNAECRYAECRGATRLPDLQEEREKNCKLAFKSSCNLGANV